MEIELEMTTGSKDVAEILQKVTQVVNSAKQQGFVIKKLEIESEDEDEDKEN
jgi:hypothetical protein